jgi:Tol biopolymer transport system component
VEIVGDPAVFLNIDLSPEGQRVAADKMTPRPGGPERDIWLMELATGRARRLTDDPAIDVDPAWSPDGKHIVFNSTRLGGWSLFMHSSDGSGGDVPVLKSGTDRDRYTVAAWSRANDLVFNVSGKGNRGDLWTMSMSGDRTPKVYVTSKHAEENGAFSLDGRWVAYQSDKSGRFEIEVRPFPNEGPANTVSLAGGRYPRWRGDGKELFFLSPNGLMMAVGFDATKGVAEGVPKELFPTQIGARNSRPYAVAKNGDRFLIPIVANPPLRAVMDWRALLDR